MMHLLKRYVYDRTRKRDMYLRHVLPFCVTRTREMHLKSRVTICSAERLWWREASLQTSVIEHALLTVGLQMSTKFNKKIRKGVDGEIFSKSF